MELCCALWVNFSADKIVNYFSYFSQKTDLTLHANCLHSTGDNLHEMSNPVFWNNIRKISSICCLLKYPRDKG